jgi:hypothetical protein
MQLGRLDVPFAVLVLGSGNLARLDRPQHRQLIHAARRGGRCEAVVHAVAYRCACLVRQRCAAVVKTTLTPGRRSALGGFATHRATSIAESWWSAAGTGATIAAFTPGLLPAIVFRRRRRAPHRKFRFTLRGNCFLAATGPPAFGTFCSSSAMR